MEDANSLLTTLINTQNRYNKLREVFKEFCAQILIASKDNPRLNMLAINKEGNTLKINYLDRKIEASFSFLIDESGNHKGNIICLLMPSTENEKPKEIDSFSYNLQGLSTIPSKDDNAYIINDPVDAVTILLNWAYASVKENF
jgi:hypothetical protein